MEANEYMAACLITAGVFMIGIALWMKWMQWKGYLVKTGYETVVIEKEK
jgi:hypothetical protein